MSLPLSNQNVVPLSPAVPRRVRVKLRPVTISLHKAYPPDGEAKMWWSRLKSALATGSSDFVSATLLQIQGASKLPCGSISETAVNAALAFIEGCEPEKRGGDRFGHPDGLYPCLYDGGALSSWRAPTAAIGMWQYWLREPQS